MSLINTIFSFSIILIVAISCDAAGNLQDISHAIDKYYLLEKKEDWSKAYHSRPSKFRQYTEEKIYTDQMASDNEGWRLMAWEVKKIDLESERLARVKIIFTEKVPVGFFMGVKQKPKTMAVEFEEVTVWIKENKKWLCKRCGTRSHLSFNSDYE